MSIEDLKAARDALVELEEAARMAQAGEMALASIDVDRRKAQAAIARADAALAAPSAEPVALTDGRIDEICKTVRIHPGHDGEMAEELTPRERKQIAEILSRRANEIAGFSDEYRRGANHFGSVELALTREIARLRHLAERV